MRLIYHPEARAELIEEARYYNVRVRGLGRRFLDAAASAVELILEAPDRWRIIEGDIRSYSIRRFPYAIIYRVLPNEIQILAFKHHSRRPDYWHHRRGN